MIELIWDAGRTGTAVASSGATTRVGDEATFSPDDMVAMGASSCLMRTFLGLAARAHIPVMSYASTADLEAPRKGASRVSVHAYVVASSALDRSRLLELFAQAQRQSSVCRLLHHGLSCTVDVQLIPGTSPTP